MGCCTAKTNDTMDENLMNRVIKNIKDNLEANLVNQAALNLDLNNMFNKYNNSDINSNNNINNNININKTISEDIIRAYLGLLINLTNITNDQDKADIKDLLFSAMTMSSNDYFSFHVYLYRKLQGMNDYSIIKAVIERDLSLKNCMKRCRPLLIEVFDILKTQKIVNISDLSHDAFKKACQRRGVKMTDNQIQNYYKVLTMIPKEFDAKNGKIKKGFENNRNMKINIEKNINGIRTLMEEIIKGGYDYYNIDVNKFEDLCKNYEIKLEYFEIESIYNLFKNNYFEFIGYIDSVGKPRVKYDETLEMKSFKLDTMARIDSQPLPVVSKLSSVQ